jgi:hypothetical protein
MKNLIIAAVACALVAGATLAPARAEACGPYRVSEEDRAASAVWVALQRADVSDARAVAVNLSSSTRGRAEVRFDGGTVVLSLTKRDGRWRVFRQV